MSPIKSLPKWTKGFFVILCFGFFIGLYSFISQEKPSDVIQDQLSKIRESKITQAYYDYTSVDFQTHTSLDTFREFVNAYPVLTNNKSFAISTSEIKDDKAIIKGILTSNTLHEMNAVFQLIKDDDDTWKILQINLDNLSPNPQNQSTLALVNKVSKQLKAMQNNDFTEAYYGFVSKNFQNETPLEDFKKFILSHPILYRYKGFEIEDQTIKNNQGVVKAVLNSDQGKAVLDYRLVWENGDWKIWSLKFNLSPEEIEKEAFTNPKAMEPPVRAFLDALLKNNIQQAYRSTAKEFQDTTSQESFREFVTHHNVFLNRDLMDMKNGQIENGVGTLNVNLHNDSGFTTALFRLGFENGEWKIWGLEIPETFSETIVKIPDSDKENKSEILSKKLQDIVQKHLSNLRYQNIQEAYSSMSENYKMRHNLENFENYLQKNPAFNMNKSSELHRISIDKKHIALQGKMTSFDEETYPVKYQLIKEGKQWKVDHFAILNNEEPITENEFALNEIPPPELPSLKIAKIIVGTQADQSGRLLVSATKINKDAPFIYINVAIKNGLDGTVLKAILEHVESKTTAPWLATTLEGNGDYVVVFSYAMPKNGWPPGEYIVKVTSITGTEAIQKFTVE